jgi:hypothetical protein
MEEEGVAKMQPVKLNQGRRWLWSSVVLVTILVCLAGGYILLHKSTPKTTIPLPKDLKQTVAFPIYYPTVLPSNYSYDPTKLSTTKDAIIYSLKYTNDRSLVFTEQSKPTAATINSIIEQMQDSKLVSVTDGEASVGHYGRNTLAVVTTNKTLILVQTTSDIDMEDLKTILKNLKPI